MDYVQLLTNETKANDVEMNDDKLDLAGTRFSNDDRTWVQRLSNQSVLSIICAMFAAFMVAEIIGALASNSLALLGDAAAMSVDVFTYFCNMYAEHLKSHNEEMDERTRFMLEVYVPLFSVTSLLCVTGWISAEAVDVIKNGGEGEETNIAFLFGFACGNLVVDGLSSWLFYQRSADVLKNRTFSFSVDANDSESTKKASANLNMMSALTHVGGDTARTLSVFVAAVVATVTGSSTLCDAWATVVVSFTILCAVFPLLIEIIKAATH